MKILILNGFLMLHEPEASRKGQAKEEMEHRVVAINDRNAISLAQDAQSLKALDYPTARGIVPRRCHHPAIDFNDGPTLSANCQYPVGLFACVGDSLWLPN